MKLTREFYIPKDSVMVKDPNSEAVAYINKEGEEPFAMLFAGKRSKYDKYYGFETAERRDEYVAEFFNNIKSHNDSKKKRKAEKAEALTENVKNAKAGDIYYTSWGYDQTNVDFYEIAEKVGAKSFMVQAIGSIVESSEPPCNYVVPDPSVKKGKPKLKRMGAYGFSFSSFETAFKWNGEPKYETTSGWGH
jgi:glycerophosphoryl diester phosphodiesterase|tara:strand:- start:208 stop:780 length:573 start_codon:yes stop_codon:yes gene_type:complete